VVLLPPQIAIQSPGCGRSSCLMLSKHSALISWGNPSRGKDRTVRSRSGPRGQPPVLTKSTPKQIPSATAAATNATPKGAASVTLMLGGILQALKSDTTAYC
jgi:hypothetical protein